MSEFIKKLVNGDLESFRNEIHNTLYTKAGEQLDNRKVEIANNIYSDNLPSEEDEEVQQQEDQE